MLHNIFDEAPPNFSDDYVGRVRLGSLVNGRPMAHDTLRFTTGDPILAEEIASMFGGNVSEWETKTEENLEVLTEAKQAEVIFESITSESVLWGRASKPIRVCNMNEQENGEKCECTKNLTSLQEWKEAARAGTACQPTVKAAFRLAENPELGIWRFQSSSWGLAMGDPSWKRDKIQEGEAPWQPPISDIEQQLAVCEDGRALGTLAVVGVDFTTKSGKHVSYTKPVITILGNAPALVES